MSSVKKTNREVLDTILFKITNLQEDITFVKNEIQYIKLRIINEKLKQEDKTEANLPMEVEETYKGWRFFN